MPRLFKSLEEIPGLTQPAEVFDIGYRIELGGHRGTLDLIFCDRGHTAGDTVVWHDRSRTPFAGDLVEAQAAFYTGDAFPFDWAATTLDRVKAFEPENLVGGRGAARLRRAAPRSMRRSSRRGVWCAA